jgi:hypothetical protein
MLDYDQLRRSSSAAEEREETLEAKGGMGKGWQAITPAQRFILALMLFLNVLVLGSLCLLALDVVALPF